MSHCLVFTGGKKRGGGAFTNQGYGKGKEKKKGKKKNARAILYAGSHFQESEEGGGQNTIRSRGGQPFLLSGEKIRVQLGSFERRREIHDVACREKKKRGGGGRQPAD